MPQPPFLNIVEIFPSIQGEGLRQGEPTIFIRFSGCKLRCTFCDTKYAWKAGKELSANEILVKVLKLREQFQADWVCLTGGEPLLQNIDSLTKILRKGSFKIQVETNATIYLPIPVDWYTVSPKPEKYFFQPEYEKKAREVKLVITKELDFEVVQKLRAKFPSKTPLLLQPQSNRKWSMNKGIKILKKTLIAGLKNIRLSIQVHKIFEIR